MATPANNEIVVERDGAGGIICFNGHSYIARTNGCIFANYAIRSTLAEARVALESLHREDREQLEKLNRRGGPNIW